jgi:transcriptional regulator with XRE-family HTH domain
MVANAAPASADFGTALRDRRTTRRYSQLALATAAGVSQRHLSFLETGRARPSREMVVHLAIVLDLPLRDRNQLLLAAGFAPAYPETHLDEPSMDQVRHVLEFILEAHNPYPALVMDRRWDVVMSNAAAVRLTTNLIDPETAPVQDGLNIARLALHPDGLRRVTANWRQVATSLLARLQREVIDRPGDGVLLALLDEVLAYPDVEELRQAPQLPTGDDLLIPVHYSTPDFEVRLMSTISTVGAPYDVTLEELRLETFYAADPESELTLQRLADVT